MKVKLSISERLAALRLLNEGGDSLNLSGLKSALDLLEMLSIDEKEQKEIDYKINLSSEDNPQTTVTWNPDAEDKSFDLNDDMVSTLKAIIDDKDKGKKFTMTEGRAIIQLSEKIEGKD